MERVAAVEAAHTALNAVTLGNSHSAVAGIGGTARASTKIAILRALKKAHGEGGTVFDVGCGFGQFMLAALLLGYKGACGCDLPENHQQQIALTHAKARLGISPDTLCEWIGSDVQNLILLERVSRRITAVYSFWNGHSKAAQLQTLEICRTLVNVRSVAVYWTTPGWTTPDAGIASRSLSLLYLSAFSKSLIFFLNPVLSNLNQGAPPTWRHYSTIKHHSVGKGEQHTAWVFHRF